jgi:hypothetical protein
MIALLAGLALALLPVAGASAAVRAVDMTLAVEVTGIHVLDWHTQSEGFGDPRREWSDERGTQTYGFSARRPLRFEATTFSGRHPGVELPPLLLRPLSSSALRLRGSVSRTLTERHNEIARCGGELGPCSGTERSGVATRRWRCGPKRVRQDLSLDVTAPSGRPQERIVLLELPPASAVYDACRSQGGQTPGAVGDSFPADDVILPGAVRKLRTLRRGGHARFRVEHEYGWAARFAGGLPVQLRSCPPLSGEGHQACVVTDITVEVTRVR